MQQHHDHPIGQQADDERCREIANLLAAGILRLRSRAALLVEIAPENPPNSSLNCLELPGETRLSVHAG